MREAFAEGRADVIYYRLGAGAGLGRKRLCNVGLSEGFAEIAVGLAQAALPARQQRARAAEARTEREVFLHERRRQPRRRGRDGVVPEVRAPRRERRVGE